MSTTERNADQLAGRPATVTRATPARATVDALQRWLAVLGVVACALQVAFAALGFWGANASSGSESATRAAFAPHAANGTALSIIAVLLLICGIIARANKLAWILPLVLAILLWVVQGMLVGLGFEVSIYFGGLHALLDMAITAGFAWLAYDRWQHPLAR